MLIKSYFTVILYIYKKNIKRLFSWSITGRFLVHHVWQNDDGSSISVSPTQNVMFTT